MVARIRTIATLLTMRSPMRGATNRGPVSCADSFLSSNPVFRRWEFVFTALPWRDAHDIHSIHLLERTPFAFDDEEVDDSNGDDETSSEDVAVGEVNRSCDKGCKESIGGQRLGMQDGRF